MSLRRQTTNRLTLIRDCGTCGKTFATTASSPFMRSVPRDGKKQAITYYCSATCKKSSYKHLFDGKADERRAAREATRDTSEKNRRYYVAHAEQERERARRNYWADPEVARENMRYYRRKKALEVCDMRDGLKDWGLMHQVHSLIS